MSLISIIRVEDTKPCKTPRPKKPVQVYTASNTLSKKTVSSWDVGLLPFYSDRQSLPSRLHQVGKGHREKSESGRLFSTDIPHGKDIRIPRPLFLTPPLLWLLYSFPLTLNEKLHDWGEGTRRHQDRPRHRGHISLQRSNQVSKGKTDRERVR